jgi:hypothetical protein
MRELEEERLLGREDDRLLLRRRGGVTAQTEGVCVRREKEREERTSVREERKRARRNGRVRKGGLGGQRPAETGFRQGPATRQLPPTVCVSCSRYWTRAGQQAAAAAAGEGRLLGGGREGGRPRLADWTRERHTQTHTHTHTHTHTQTQTHTDADTHRQKDRHSRMKKGKKQNKAAIGRQSQQQARR